MTEARPGAPSLASMLEEVARCEAAPEPVGPELRIALLRNYTIEPLVPFLQYFGYRSGLEPRIALGGYDTIQQEILDQGSVAYADAPDLVVLTWVLEHLDPQSKRADWNPTQAREGVLGAISATLERTSALVVVTTLLPPLHAERDLLGSVDPDHRIRKVEAINDAIRAAAHQSGGRAVVVDFSRILERVGAAAAIDYRFWYMNRAPFGRVFLESFAREVVRIGRTLKGRIKKCLVLDCDNTLWGGVVGEDGLSGIALDPHEYPGRCFHDFQQSVLNLIDQGVIVALASKNNEADAWEVLDSHPHTLLRRSHIAAHRINWDPKPGNLAAMAEELNIGLDSFVFVDDSGVECELVRQSLPEVTVLQAPSTPYDLPRLIFEAGVFDTLGVSAEDRKRTDLYRAERERREVETSFGSVEHFLRSLELRATIHPAPASELPRVTQLTGKTNQFNLTTRRYTEGEIESLAADPDAAVMTMAAGDRFGDLGIIAVLIARRTGDVGHIESFLMSCRALGRRLEQVFLYRSLERLERAWELSRWTAEYRPTRKNGLVAEFWPDRGFKEYARSDEGVSYSLQIENRARLELDYIDIRED